MFMMPMAFAAAMIVSPYRPLPADSEPAVATTIPAKADCSRKDRKMTVPSANRNGIADLPYAFGKQFETLDAYLDHLECYAGPVDLPWWKQVAPGTYRLMTSGTVGKTEIATREQLQKRFGFRR